jgi:hypothetical protein
MSASLRLFFCSQRRKIHSLSASSQSCDRNVRRHRKNCCLEAHAGRSAKRNVPLWRSRNVRNIIPWASLPATNNGQYAGGKTKKERDVRRIAPPTADSVSPDLSRHTRAHRKWRTEKTERWSCVSSGALVSLSLLIVTALGKMDMPQLERTWLIFWANFFSFDEERWTITPSARTQTALEIY